MPYASSGDVRLFYEETGSGTPLVFLHEFGGDWRSWEAQVRYFSRSFRCITLNARGYTPSDVPERAEDYSQDIVTRDVIAVLDHLGIPKAHVVGLSMGAYTALMVAARFPGRVLSVIAAGGGSGAEKAGRTQFIDDARTRAAAMDKSGRIEAEASGLSPTRVQLLLKDPRGWAQFVKLLGEHSAAGSARTLRGVQAMRPSLYDCEAELKGIKAPVLLVVGDEDEPCLDVNLWMKRLLPNAELSVMPRAGHAINLEEPALFNRILEMFLFKVVSGAWRPRDPRAMPPGA
jgi:pimeloyl-ACP methyl ester carboxylesterase